MTCCHDSRRQHVVKERKRRLDITSTNHPLRRLVAVVFGLLSLAVLAAEVTISPQLPNLSLFSRALHSMEGDQTMTEIACFAFLAYPVACAYYGLYKCAPEGLQHVPGDALCHGGFFAQSEVTVKPLI